MTAIANIFTDDGRRITVYKLLTALLEYDYLSTFYMVNYVV